MTLHNAAAAVFCIVLNCVHIEAQDSLPLPTLSFHSSVNLSDIHLFSTVKLSCTIPNRAPFPVSVFISQAEDPKENPEPWASFSNLRSADIITFTVIISHEKDDSFVCWYKSLRTTKASGLSNSVNVTINSVAKPTVMLDPSPIFPVGGSYTVYCITFGSQLNVTLSLYERQLPLRHGNESFTFLGSITLRSQGSSIYINRTNVVKSVEYACQIKVFYKGSILQSTSSPVAAIPDELPARLYSDTRGSAACSGYLSLRVKEDWTPMCFLKNDANEEAVANVTCREVNCGYALHWGKNTDSGSKAVGTPTCTGKEKRLAECPIVNQTGCEKALFVICSGAMPPPKLSVEAHGSGPWVYVKPEESARLNCTFESPSLTQDDWIYLSITYEGQEITYTFTRPGRSWVHDLSPPVKEGQYACFAHPSSGRLKKTDKSNSVHIRIYIPPPAGVIAGAVITTVAGAAILMFICMFRKSQEQESASLVTGSPALEVTQPGDTATLPPPEEPVITDKNLPQV